MPVATPDEAVAAFSQPLPDGPDVHPVAGQVSLPVAEPVADLVGGEVDLATSLGASQGLAAAGVDEPLQEPGGPAGRVVVDRPPTWTVTRAPSSRTISCWYAAVGEPPSRIAVSRARRTSYSSGGQDRQIGPAAWGLLQICATSRLARSTSRRGRPATARPTRCHPPRRAAAVRPSPTPTGLRASPSRVVRGTGRVGRISQLPVRKAFVRNRPYGV